ncbi:MAG: DUF1697 domain-containing protein [Actinomycetota bacterium]
MTLWAALLRGINVGGHNKIPMAELRAALTDAGFDDVATYIASGNVVLRADRCEPERVSAIIAERFGLDIAVVVRSAEQVGAVIEANPFPDLAGTEPKFVHCYFTSTPVPDTALDGFDHDRYGPDRVAVAAGELVVAYPDGVARSKLTTAVLDRVAGGPTTGRNWNTVLKLESMLAAAGGPGGS